MEEETALNPVGNVIETIRAHIYDIRGKKVMLDRDLAELYHVETSQLNRQVNRNAERFPPDFMFKISIEELQENLICQNGTSSYGGNRKPISVFTEQGIAMLSGLLRSKIAIQMNINIMRAFVLMRQALSELSATNLRMEQLSRRVDNLNPLILIALPHHSVASAAQQRNLTPFAVPLAHEDSTMTSLAGSSTPPPCKWRREEIGRSEREERRTAPDFSRNSQSHSACGKSSQNTPKSISILPKSGTIKKRTDFCPKIVPQNGKLL